MIQKMLKRKLGRGSKIAKGGSYPPADLDLGGSKSTVTPAHQEEKGDRSVQ